MNGRASDALRTVHLAVLSGDAPYAACEPPKPWEDGTRGGLYLPCRTFAPVTCKKCLKLLAKGAA